MKFSTFFSKAFFHAFVWAELLFGLLAPAQGHENLAVFIIGMFSAIGVVGMLLDGGLKSIDVPGSFIGRAVFQLFQFSSLLLIILVVEHGHFVAATALTLATFLKAAAYRTVRRAERDIKRMLKEFANAKAQPQSTADAPFEDPASQTKITTLELKGRPAAARDPAFDHPFNASAAAATSA